MTDYEPKALLDMAAINAAVDRMTPAQRAEADAEMESVLLGMDVMRLAREYRARGNLHAALGWYVVAARHNAEGADELIAETEALIAVTVDSIHQPITTESPALMTSAPKLPLTTVYISIGNSDDKLTQAEWAEFQSSFVKIVTQYATSVYGEWYSAPNVAFQNACMAIGIYPTYTEPLQGELTQMREHYQQDSVAWAVAPTTEFI